MVNMAESSKAFKMCHYQQIKCETKTEVDQYMKIRDIVVRKARVFKMMRNKQGHTISKIYIHG